MRMKWTFDSLKEEALKYKTRGEFAKNSKSAYQSAYSKKIIDTICSHMPIRVDQSGSNSARFKWTTEMLQAEALKYNTRSDLYKNDYGAYNAIKRRKLFDLVCKHMEPSFTETWTEIDLKKEALKYKSKIEFRKKNIGAHNTAYHRGILDQICSHMKPSRCSSFSELELLAIIKQKYPSAKKIRDRKVKIEGKPHIHEFEIDIFIPELNRGIEFDGNRYHSMEGLIEFKSKKWPLEDAINKHQIKDDYFLSKGIKLLHITDLEWLNNKEQSLLKILQFLRN